ncbi:hypothetical protein [Pseudovibrio sp. Alg231-02]|uniref:hypothetical protein n=1 Tax=Pseudovibrio sp. Alg231-02 TaxID=1922223 RepID=UPI000D5625E7|nr:hypothetical protein [Pseudovibrio sp. Alg231-02]
MTIQLEPALISGGHAISDTALMLHAVPDKLNVEEYDFTRVFYLNLNPAAPKEWAHQDWLDASVVSTCDIKNGPAGMPAGCELSNHGLVKIHNSYGTEIEQIPGAGLIADDGRGELTCMRRIGKKLFACGINAQVYKRDEGRWHSIGGKMGEKVTTLLERRSAIIKAGEYSTRSDEISDIMDQIPYFIFINGIAEDDIYVTGSRNTIYHFDGTEWERVLSDTEASLSDIHPISKDEIYITGFEGTLLKGNAKEGFRSIVDPLSSYLNFLFIRKFQDKVYVGNDDGLFQLQGDRIVKVDEYPGKQVRILDSVSDNILWLACARHAYRFDGIDFHVHEHPDNIGL